METTCDPLMVDVVRDTVASVAGCDSINVTTITLVPSSRDTFRMFTCDPLQVDTTIETYVNSAGCDSVIVNMVLFLEFIEPTVIQQITCDPLLVGSDTTIFMSNAGCDSVVIQQIILGSFSIEIDPALSNISEGDSVILTLTSNDIDLSMANITWTPPIGLSCDTCISVVVYPSETTTYLATVVDNVGCQGIAVAVINVSGIAIYIPNAFTPNNDQINDVFTIYTDRSLMIESFDIYNRWGDRVFQRQNQLLIDFDGWDGFVQDDRASEDVYVYAVKVIIDGIPKVLKGEIHLVR